MSMVGAEPENFENLKMFSKASDYFFKALELINFKMCLDIKCKHLESIISLIVIPKILKVWPSFIAGKRSFVAYTIYQKSGPALFLVAQVYLIFYHYISRIYELYLLCSLGGGGVYTPGRYVPEFYRVHMLKPP